MYQGATRESVRVARSPSFGVRGSSVGKSSNLKYWSQRLVWEREPREEPQTAKPAVCATLAATPFVLREHHSPCHPEPALGAKDPCSLLLPVRRDKLPGSFGPRKCLGPQDDSALG